MPLWSTALPTPPEPSERILRVVRPIWAQMHTNPRMAGATVAAGLRADRSLGAKERPVAGDLLLGLVRHARALARIDTDPLSAWLTLAREGPPPLEDPENAYAIACSVPDWIADEWWDRLGPPAAIEHARVIAGRAPVTLRVLRDPVDIPVAHHREGRAITLEGRTNLDLLPAYREGRVEVQDLHSQEVVDFAFPGVGARVLDLCAGAGGKSLSLAALGARVQAWDVRPQALRELDKRARRAGLDIRIAPPAGRYDLILVDAPCSGTGVLRRHPENRWNLHFPVETQSSLLARALEWAPTVVYATCSLMSRENELLVRTVAEPILERTWWPSAGGGEGFFVAKLLGK